MSHAGVERIRLHRLRMPLVRPFRTSFGTQSDRDVILIELTLAGGATGWGECAAMAWPGYNSEYTDGAIAVMREYLVPALIADASPRTPEDADARFEPIRGHAMAKAAISTAFLDAWLRREGRSLANFLGAERTQVDCGVSVGIPAGEDIAALLEEVTEYVTAGYRRIKLKIEPGWDLEPVSVVRDRWPTMALQVDANQAYTRADADHLAQLDPFDLLLIEQPLHEDDLYGHALLAERCQTPICLDESILSLAVAEAAIRWKATTIVNIKPGRVGGYLPSKAIHDLCTSMGIPVWCGGMLETGLGRAANIALAALPGFTLPGDTSASDRYYRMDITEPFVLVDGRLSVPTGPGIGIDPIPSALDEVRVSVTDLYSSS